MNYTKTAISIPQDIFERGEQAAAELGISRSELYARSLKLMLRERKLAAARARLDEALARDCSDADTRRQAEELHGIAGATMHRAAQRGESTW